jgi:hypothetical protein
LTDERKEGKKEGRGGTYIHTGALVGHHLAKKKGKEGRRGRRERKGKGSKKGGLR